MISFCLVSSRVSISSVTDLVTLSILQQAIAFVLTHLAVLDGLVDGFLGLTANVAHGDLAILGLALGELDVFLTTILGEFRHGQTDDVAITVRADAEIGVAQGLFDGTGLGSVKRGDGQGARFGNADGGDGLNRGGGTIVVHGDAVEQGRVCATGADAGEVFLGVFHGLGHLFLGLVDKRHIHSLCVGVRQCCSSMNA